MAYSDHGPFVFDHNWPPVGHFHIDLHGALPWLQVSLYLDGGIGGNRNRERKGKLASPALACLPLVIQWQWQQITKFGLTSRIVNTYRQFTLSVTFWYGVFAATWRWTQLFSLSEKSETLQIRFEQRWQKAFYWVFRFCHLRTGSLSETAFTSGFGWHRKSPDGATAPCVFYVILSGTLFGASEAYIIRLVVFA